MPYSFYLRGTLDVAWVVMHVFGFSAVILFTCGLPPFSHPADDCEWLHAIDVEKAKLENRFLGTDNLNLQAGALNMRCRKLATKRHQRQGFEVGHLHVAA